MTDPTYLVRLPSGVVVQHTREEYERYMKGVDVEAAKALAVPPKPDPCLVRLEKGTGGGTISEKSWQRARNCPFGCGSVCQKVGDPRRRPVDPNECQEGC